MNLSELIQNFEQSLKVARQAIDAWSADGPQLVPARVPLTHTPASSAQAAWEDDGGSPTAATLNDLV